MRCPSRSWRAPPSRSSGITVTLHDAVELCQHILAAELYLQEGIRLLAVGKRQRGGIPCLKRHLNLVKVDLSGTAHAYLPDGIEYVPVVMAPLPAVLEQPQEVLPAVGEVDAEELMHLLRHLPEGYGALQRAGLLHERVYIVVDVKRP